LKSDTRDIPLTLMAVYHVATELQAKEF